MKVTISVGGRFHAFYLAQQLLKRDRLGQLITSYPKFEVKKYGIPGEKISSVVIKEILHRGWARLPGSFKGIGDPQYLIHEAYDHFAAKAYKKSDICVAWAGFGLRTIRKARSLGAVTVIERGSSHILSQAEILRAEYERQGMKTRPAHPKLIAKELLEYEEADFISIPSLFVKRTFLERGFPEEKLLHVPYGVELDSFRQVPRSDAVFRVVYCGGMTIRKGVHSLLQAFSELRLNNSELLLVGSLTDEIRPFFKKYEGSYKWVGHIPQRELCKYYSQGSVFSLMSVEEGLAMVIPQAMACGLPVICTTNTGGEDIVRDGTDGYVVPVRDVDALKEKLAYLYAHQDICRQMGRSARSRVSSGFTWDDYGEKICRKYAELVRARTEVRRK